MNSPVGGFKLRLLHVAPGTVTEPAALNFVSRFFAPSVSVYVATVNWRPVSAPEEEEQI